MKTDTVLPPLRHKPYGGAWSVHDTEALEFIANLNGTDGNRQKFIDDYYQWFKANNNFHGIERFKYLDFTAGTTETFHMFYYRHINKRLRLFKDEYFYHHMMRRNYFKRYDDLELATLSKGDVVVMSCPFSGNGTIPKDFYNILEKCNDLSIPVMLDLAYINISNLQELDLRYDCIETITTSLSKIFPVEQFRIGIRLEKKLFDDPVHAYNQNNYVNLRSVHIGHSLIKNFDNKWLMNKYHSLQLETCNSLGVAPSDCVIFGIAEAGTYDEYNRGGPQNRLCFSKVWDGRIDGKN